MQVLDLTFTRMLVRRLVPVFSRVCKNHVPACGTTKGACRVASIRFEEFGGWARQARWRQIRFGQRCCHCATANGSGWRSTTGPRAAWVPVGRRRCLGHDARPGWQWLQRPRAGCRHGERDAGSDPRLRGEHTPERTRMAWRRPRPPRGNRPVVTPERARQATRSRSQRGGCSVQPLYRILSFIL